MQSTAIAAVEAAFRSFAKLIVCLTHSGRWVYQWNPNWIAYFASIRSARLIAQYRPRAVIMAVTRNLKTARQAHLYRGCCPVYVVSKFVRNWFIIRKKKQNISFFSSTTK